MHWALGAPGIFLNTVGDLALLPKVLDAASRFEKRPSDEAMAGMLEREANDVAVRARDLAPPSSATTTPKETAR